MGSAHRDHRRDHLRPGAKLVLDHRARERRPLGGGARRGRQLRRPGQLQRAVVHRHGRPDPAAHAGEVSRGEPGARRRHRHQRRVDGHRSPLRHQRDAARVPRRANRRLHDEHHPPSGHRRARVRRRRVGDLPRGASPSRVQAGPGRAARRAHVRRHPQQRASAGAGLRRPDGERHLQRGRRPPAPRLHGRVRTRRPRTALRGDPRAERAGHPGPDRGPPRRDLRGSDRHRGDRRPAPARLPRRDCGRGDRARLRGDLPARQSRHQRAVLLYAGDGPLRGQVPHRARHAQQRGCGGPDPGHRAPAAPQRGGGSPQPGAPPGRTRS